MYTESNDPTRLAYRAVNIAFMKLDKTQAKIAACLIDIKSASSEERRRELTQRHGALEAEWEKDYRDYVEANRAYLKATGHPQ